MVRESLEPGQSVSVVARRNGINANLAVQVSLPHLGIMPWQQTLARKPLGPGHAADHRDRHQHHAQADLLMQQARRQRQAEERLQ